MNQPMPISERILAEKATHNLEKIKNFESAMIAMTLHKHKSGEDHLISDKEASKLSIFARAQNGDMHDRQAVSNMKKKNKIERLREEKEIAEVEGCTFTPEIYTRKRGQ